MLQIGRGEEHIDVKFEYKADRPKQYYIRSSFFYGSIFFFLILNIKHLF